MPSAFDLRMISVAAVPLAIGAATPEIVAAFYGSHTDDVALLADAARKAGKWTADGLGSEPTLAIQIAAGWLAWRLTTPELLRASLFAAYPDDATASLVEAAEKLARQSRTWRTFHPTEDPEPKSKADRDADMLGKPRPADPRAADADAPSAKPETALERGLRDGETAALIARVRSLAAGAPNYENAVAMTTALRQLGGQPEGGSIIEELRREEAATLARLNAQHDASARDEQLRRMGKETPR